MSAVATARDEGGPEARVRAAMAGDRQAFTALYREHARMVHGVLLARLPRTELRDAMQDVFTTALDRLDSLREPGRFGPWLATIARNQARDWHRRHGNKREISRDPVGLDDRRPGEPRDLDGALTLLTAVRTLPEPTRELLVLRFVEGLRGPEIAQALGMTPGSVRVKLHRAMTELRSRLDVEGARS